MTRLAVIILTLCFLKSYGQRDTTRAKIQFKIIQYSFDRKKYMTQLKAADTISLPGNKIDLCFFRQHFYIPYYLPDEFINRKYKSETITRWANGKVDTGDFKTNWKETFTYDSLSRVVNYSNSSCMACNYIKYSYDVTYNKIGQVIMLSATNGISQAFRIFYDRKGNIRELDSIGAGKLEERIIRL